MKLCERIIERRLRSDLTCSNQQYGFIPGKSNTDALYALRVLMEKYRKVQKKLHCVFVDLEKAYDKVTREEVWYCMIKSGLAEKYVRIVHTSKEPVCPRVELILKIIIILLIIFLGFSKNKPC